MDLFLADPEIDNIYGEVYHHTPVCGAPDIGHQHNSKLEKKQTAN